MAWKSISSNPVLTSPQGGERIVPQSSLKGLKLPRSEQFQEGKSRERLPGTEDWKDVTREKEISSWYFPSVYIWVVQVAHWANSKVIIPVSLCDSYRQKSAVHNSETPFTLFPGLKMVIVRVLRRQRECLEHSKGFRRSFSLCTAYVTEAKWVPGKACERGRLGSSDFSSPLGAEKPENLLSVVNILLRVSGFRQYDFRLDHGNSKWAFLRGGVLQEASQRPRFFLLGALDL